MNNKYMGLYGEVLPVTNLVIVYGFYLGLALGHPLFFPHLASSD